MLLEEISNQIGIEVSENVQSGRVDVTLSDGRPLVSGDKAYELKTSPSANDPNKTIVSYVDANGKETPLDEDRITKGRLAGLFKFRNEDLTLARQELDKMAFIMASRMNAQNRDGYLPDGTQGGDLFSLPPIAARANSGNMGTGKLGPIEVTDYKLVNAEEYTISYDATGWKVRGADGRLVKEGRPDDTEIEFDGLKIELPDPGDMADGDSFTFNPMSGAAEGLSRKITDAQGFAASDSEDPADKGNNKNLQKMLEIQNEPLIGGSTLAEAYASLVGTIGDNARNVKSNLTSAEIDMQTKFETKQALSGVSMDEEKINLDMFMQYYRANAQLLQTANNMFDSLLAIR